ncbi:DUF6879 family protein [Kitasatospora kifunensis]|uniref:DUF6879 domain-containing protein n=1 Tax=Kitasatospora kifunensis TaxID=58351 RepID=A0A7W7R482_KITKI|nr:DUF6879 family protein [Kitasatospora kifunensis]MBB4924935.1 hypothetical protein [Kitasatospora kifunensis]
MTTFKELFNTCKHRAVHLEMRDSYMQTEQFAAWRAGRIDIDDPDSVEWRALVADATARGVQVQRLRIVSEPLSEYTRYEYDITELHNAAAGEDVRWLPRRQATALSLPGNDFWVFDTTTLLVNHFSGAGDWLDTEVVTDPALVAHCVAAFNGAWNLAVPHAEYRPT